MESFEKIRNNQKKEPEPTIERLKKNEKTKERKFPEQIAINEEINKAEQRNLEYKYARETRISIGLAPEIELTSSIEYYLDLAERQIETNRKEQIILGNLEPGVKYQIEQETRTFPFGTAVNFNILFANKELLLEKYPDREEEIEQYFAKLNENYRQKYFETLKQLFNGIVAENVFKWDIMMREGAIDYSMTDKVMRFLRANPELLENFRGHTIFWNRREHLPPHLKDKSKEEVFRALLEERLDILRKYPEIKEWDLINEPLLREPYIEQGVNKNKVVFDPNKDIHYFVELFKQAKEINPNTKFYINEYGILSGNKLREFVEFVQKLKEYGAPIDGIGVQCHITEKDFASIAQLHENLETLSYLGLPIKITEFDVSREVIEKMYFPPEQRQKEKEKLIEEMRSFYVRSKELKAVFPETTSKKLKELLKGMTIAKYTGQKEQEIILEQVISSENEEQFLSSLKEKIGKIVSLNFDKDFDEKVEKSRADYVRKALTIFYGNPYVNGVYFWGFQDRLHWRSQQFGEHVGFFDDNFEPNKTGAELLRLLNEKWKTKITAVADSSGRIKFRGFSGRYKVKKLETKES